MQLIIHALRWETGQIYHKMMADWDYSEEKKSDSKENWHTRFFFKIAFELLCLYAIRRVKEHV